MRKLLKRVREVIPDGWDVLGFAGVVCLSVGLFRLAGPGWVFVFVGAVLVAVGYMGASHGISKRSR